MNNFFKLFLPILVFVFISLSGCYIEPGESDNEQNAITIDLQTQNAVGYAGYGRYVKVYIYPEEDVDAMLANETITIDQFSNYYYYSTSSLLPPIDTQAYYYGPVANNVSIGTIIVALPARRYRLILELVDYTAVAMASNYSAITDGFEVKTGENTVVSEVVFYFHS